MRRFIGDRGVECEGVERILSDGSPGARRVSIYRIVTNVTAPAVVFFRTRHKAKVRVGRKHGLDSEVCSFELRQGNLCLEETQTNDVGECIRRDEQRRPQQWNCLCWSCPLCGDYIREDEARLCGEGVRSQLRQLCGIELARTTDTVERKR